MDFLNGKKCTIPRGVGLNIDRFLVDEEMLFFKSVNAYGKTYNRICIPPDYVMLALEKSR